MSSNKTICELYQVINVKTLDVVYPFCQFCLKKVVYLGNEQKFVCYGCNEKFYNVDYRFRVCLDVTNLSKIINISVFGKNLESIFGVDCHKFIKYRDKISKSENWNECLSRAFRFCLVDRWFEFEFERAAATKKAGYSTVARRISIPKMEKANFLTISDYLRSMRCGHSRLDFSVFELSSDQLDDSSIVNETISTETDCSVLSKGLKSVFIND